MAEERKIQVDGVVVTVPKGEEAYLVTRPHPVSGIQHAYPLKPAGVPYRAYPKEYVEIRLSEIAKAIGKAIAGLRKAIAQPEAKEEEIAREAESKFKKAMREAGIEIIE